ncbi:MAG: T9SS type A sorting domain-containing protein [bacterium]|nr:T9SS type A sorting domain-containing protein [bacterium]
MRSVVSSIIFISLLCITTPALAHECVDYCLNMHLLSQTSRDPDVSLIDVTREGDLAYVIGYDSVVEAAEFIIYDVSDEENPAVIGMLSIPTPDPVREAELDGSTAYLATSWQPFGEGALYIVDILDPLTPTLMATDYIGGSDDIEVSDGYLYALCNVEWGTSYLNVYSLANPYEPAFAGTIALPVGWPYAAYEIEISNGYGYIPGSYEGLIVVDVTDPVNPHTAAVEPFNGADRIAVDGDRAYLTTFGGTLSFHSLDISNPLAIVTLDSIELPGTSRVYLHGDRAYVAYGGAESGAHGFEVVDIADPTDMQPLGRFGGAGSTQLAPGPDNILAIGTYSGLQVIALEGGAPAQRAGGASEDDNYFLQHVFMNGDLAYLCGQNAPMIVVDTTDPTDHKILASWPYRISGMKFSGDLAYTLTDFNLQVLNLADPGNPIFLGSVPMGWPRGLVVDGPLAYVADSHTGLEIVDVSNPNDPFVVGTQLEEGYWDVAVAGGYAYAADGGDGIRVIDISNPATPTLVATLPTFGRSESILTDGEYLYVADNGVGVLIFGLTDPALPNLVTQQEMGHYNTYAISLSGDYLYAANDRYGLSILDVGNPAQPLLCGNLAPAWGGRTYDVFAGESVVLMADGYGGFSVAWHQCGAITTVAEVPAAQLKVGCFPNPFNPKTTISLNLPSAGHYRVAAYDVSGRQVVELATRSFPAGDHAIEWSGCDDTGASLPSGIYLIQAEGQGSVVTTKAVLLK